MKNDKLVPKENACREWDAENSSLERKTFEESRDSSGQEIVE